jgi:hypothetical protein
MSVSTLKSSLPADAFLWLSKEAFFLGNSSLNGTGSTNGSGGGSAANSQLVAIDSKIEQAMDLVKTHLMFAVREEVEILRARILELETTVIQLEAENAILREHVPSDILKNLSLQQAPGSMAQAALAQ